MGFRYYNHFRYSGRAVIANGDLNAWTEEMMRLPLACNGCALQCANRLMLGAYSYW